MSQQQERTDGIHLLREAPSLAAGTLVSSHYRVGSGKRNQEAGKTKKGACLVSSWWLGSDNLLFVTHETWLPAGVNENSRGESRVFRGQTSKVNSLDILHCLMW